MRQALNFLSLPGDVIDEELFSELVWAGVEGAALVDAGHLIDKVPQHRAIV